MTLQQHLELICKHLPHKVMYSHNGNVAELMPYHLGMHLKNIERGDDWKLCLRPLSDLVKPCLKGGKVPIEEILRSMYPEEETQGPYSKIEFEQDKRTVVWFRFAEHKAVTVSHNFDEYVPLSIIDKLYQWGFYLGDQSLFGKEIIDINTLNTCSTK